MREFQIGAIIGHKDRFDTTKKHKFHHNHLYKFVGEVKVKDRITGEWMPYCKYTKLFENDKTEFCRLKDNFYEAFEEIKPMDQ